MPPPPTTMPGLRGTDHIGFTVPDLEQAVSFFVDVLGCQIAYYLGPFQVDDEWMDRQLAVPAGVVMKRLCFLRCANGSNFEIFEYAGVDRRCEQPRNSDVGGHHLAFYVDDFDAALTFLQERGLRILGTPTVRTDGPSGGQTWIYFLSPWGMQLELVSYPQGKFYEQNSDMRLWHPAEPAR